MSTPAERTTHRVVRDLGNDPLYDAVAQASSARVISAYSTSFAWAGRLLGRDVRPHVRNVYALVRVADEVVDGPLASTDVERASRLLTGLEIETYDALRTGYSTNLVVHAFALTARRCGIDRDLIAPFFDSMRADLRVSSHDAQSLRTYIHGSAEVVGLMCLRAFLAVDGPATGPDRAAAYAALSPGAARLGAAFQKVNFLRDLATDHDELGRSYFPGVDVGTLTAAQRDALCDDIDADLLAADAAIRSLPPSARRAVRAAHGLFAELNRRLRACAPAELRVRRVRVPTRRKARILVTAALTGGGRA